MEPSEAERIVSDYGKAMEETAGMSSGAPESALPYPKKKIKRALRDCLAVIGADNQEAERTLGIGYITLATFIPDDLAAISQKGQQEITNLQPGGSAPKYVGSMLAHQKAISTEQEKLRQEWGEYKADIGFGTVPETSARNLGAETELKDIPSRKIVAVATADAFKNILVLLPTAGLIYILGVKFRPVAYIGFGLYALMAVVMAIGDIFGTGAGILTLIIALAGRAPAKVSLRDELILSLASVIRVIESAIYLVVTFWLYKSFFHG